MVKEQSKILMTAEEMRVSLRNLAQEVLEDYPDLDSLIIVGIRTGGAYLAMRLKNLIHELARVEIRMAIIDITLYRDDWTRISNTPIVGKTEMPFSIEGRPVLLVDDVIFTGRTIRAAMDALIDFGRPQSIALLALVDRGGRELPICAQYVALKQEVRPEEKVNVYLTEKGGKDEVVVERHDV